MSESDTPFTTLGRHLRYVREQQSKTLAEVSGAVEIDEKSLELIEAGKERPSEDILMLLISHFGMNDQQAVRLWELADYGGELPSYRGGDTGQDINKQVVMLIATDPKTVYSDEVEAIANKAGVTLTFSQASGPKSSTVVSKIGMSQEQAGEVIRQIQLALLKSKYEPGKRQLPPTATN